MKLREREPCLKFQPEIPIPSRADIADLHVANDPESIKPTWSTVMQIRQIRDKITQWKNGPTVTHLTGLPLSLHHGIRSGHHYSARDYGRQLPSA